MRVSLLPGLITDQVTDLTEPMLKSWGIRLLLCDLDYTLAPAAIGDEFIVVPAQGNTWSNSETDTIELSDEIKLLQCVTQRVQLCVFTHFLDDHKRHSI